LLSKTLCDCSYAVVKVVTILVCWSNS